MIRLRLPRYDTRADSSLGILYDITKKPEALCYTLEDEKRLIKVPGETRISAGLYPITLRTTGGFNDRYSRRFPDIHKGMIWIRDVENFEWVLIHCGNDDDDTGGCPLVGDRCSPFSHSDHYISGSSLAYKRIYPRIAAGILAGGLSTIEVVDYA